MEHKLTLEQLAPYLPYGLKIKTKHGLHTMNSLNDHCVNFDYEESFYYEDELEFKPLLHPLSRLTQEIEHNGKRIVPLFEIGIVTGLVRDDQKIINSEHRDGLSLIEVNTGYYSEKSDGDIIRTISFSDTVIITDSVNNKITGEKSELKRQFYIRPTFEVFKKLAEWKIDFQGLIDQNLALPIEQ